MQVAENPHRGRGLDHPALAAMPWPAADPADVTGLLARCPRHAPTPLLSRPDLAEAAGVDADVVPTTVDVPDGDPPPESEVPAPRGTTLTPWSRQ